LISSQRKARTPAYLPFQRRDPKVLLFFAEVPDMREMRSESRHNIMARIDALWQDETGAEKTSQGKVEDMSDGGLCIRVNDEIIVGTKMVVRFHLGNFSGIVVNARKHGKEYVLGIKRDSAKLPEGK
jgi:hypothetical protein